ncbi:unnamed protein product [Candida parapsilosis]
MGAGLHLLPSIIATVISSIVAGGAGLLSLLRVDSPFSKQVGLLIIMGAATGSQFQPAMLSAQIKAPKTPGAIAATLSDAVYTSSLNNFFKKNIPKASAEVQQSLQSIDISNLMSNNAILRTLDPATEKFIKEQMMKSIQNVFYMCIGLAAITTLACPFVSNKKLPDTKQVAKVEKKKEEIEQGDATEAEKEAQ